MVKSKRNMNRPGAVLLTVLTVACFAAILLTAVLSFVRRAHTNAYKNYNSEQAYYIASSAIYSINNSMDDGTGTFDRLLKMAEGSGTVATVSFKDATGATSTVGDFIKGGDCKVAVQMMGTAYVKVSVTGTYNGQEETINAYYSIVTNSIPAQIDNALYSDSNATFSIRAASMGSITTREDYTTSNNGVANGSVITGGNMTLSTQYSWTTDPSNKANSYIIVAGNFVNNNSSVSFIPNNPKLDDNTTQFISVGGTFNPQADLTVGASGREMDVYCNTALFNSGAGTKLTMYGNLYCYKNDTNTNVTNNGSLILSSSVASMALNGNLYVEGNLVNDSGHEVRVNGTLYITDTAVISGSKPIICDSISAPGLTTVQVAQLINSDKIKIAKTPGGNSYCTSTDADLANHVKQDAIEHGTATSRNYQPSTKFDDYQREYETTEDFIKNSVNVKSEYEKANNKSITALAAPITDSVFSGTQYDYTYVVKESCYIDANAFTEPSGKNYLVLIDMENASSQDLVIRLKASADNKVNLNNIVFIVKNGEQKQGGWVKEPKGFCYFIVEDKTQPITVEAGGATIFDYYTYKNVVKDGRAINLTAYNGNDDTVQNYLNAATGYKDNNGADKGIYTINPIRTYLMANDGDIINATGNNNNRSGNPTVMEAIIYAPGAQYNGGNNGSSDFYYLKNNGINVEKLSSDARLSVIGAVICGSFNDGSNTFGIAFVAPAPGSGVGASSSEAKTKVSFDHFESR